MKYIGIDYGDERIGLAIGETGSIALPYSIVSNDDSFWQYIRQLIADEHIDAAVVGWPISMSGNENARTERTTQFIGAFTANTHIPVYREDERLTSGEASRKGVQGRVDAAAAASILQSYLDRHAAA